jgi:hypothetical protein
LQVKNSSAGVRRWTYLRFPIGGLTGSVTSAKLRLHGSRTGGGTVSDSVYAVSNLTWGEQTITYNNRPTLGAKQGSGVPISATAKYHEWTITSYVQAQKAAGATAISLAVQMDASTDAAPDSFSSRDAASNRPQLVISTVVNGPPTVPSPAAASPPNVMGTTTTLSVLGADDQGEAALTYTWATTGTPPAPVTFSANGSNAAKNTTATFTASGSYNLQVTVKDAAGLTSVSSVTVTVTLPSSVTLPAVADAYVRDGSSAATNFGTAASLEVKATADAGNNRVAYLRFSLAGVGANVASAKLRLYGVRPTAHPTVVGAYAVASTTWSETTINHNNRPALGTRQSGLAPGTTAQYYEWDVTAHVKAQKAAGATSVSVALRMDAQVTFSPDTFNAREASGNRPQLVVTAQ